MKKRELFTQIAAPTLRARIADQMREAILQGRLQAGEKVVERKLAAEFGASLTAIREAVITLETEGFISKKQNSATYITSLDAEAVGQIFEVRRLLEPYAAARASELASEADRKKLCKLHDGMLAAASKGDVTLYVQRDYALHSEIWTIAGNEFLQTALSRLTLRLFSFSAIRFSADHAFNLLADARSHKDLLQAVVSGDRKRASSLMAAALESWRDEIITFLDRQDVSSQIESVRRSAH